MVIDETNEGDVMKKALLVILASAAAAQVSAYPKGNFSTGNDWLWQAQSEEFSTRIAARAFLSGMNDMHWYSGLAGECVPTPEEVIYGQIEAVVIKWLEDNPDERHLPMVAVLHTAKKEAWGSTPITPDDPVC